MSRFHEAVSRTTGERKYFAVADWRAHGALRQEIAPNDSIFEALIGSTTILRLVAVLFDIERTRGS